MASNNNKNNALSDVSTDSVKELLAPVIAKGDKATFRDIYECIWLPKKRSTIVSWRQEAVRIERVLLPALGDKPIKDISPTMVMTAIADYEHKIPTLQRLCMRVNEIINFALCADIVDRNRCAKLRVIYPHKKTEHLAYLPASELCRLFLLLNKEKVPAWFKLFVIYHIYAMARPNESASLKWEYIKGDVITLPATLMKGKREHRIWLCPQMHELLKGVYALSQYKNDYVFPFGRGGKHINKQHIAKWLQHSVLAGQVTAHGLRATGRTWLRDVGCPAEIAEDFLAHVYGSPTERAYIRTDFLEQRKPYYQKWFDYIKNQLFISMSLDDTALYGINAKTKNLKQIGDKTNDTDSNRLSL